MILDVCTSPFTGTQLNHEQSFCVEYYFLNLRTPESFSFSFIFRPSFSSGNSRVPLLSAKFIFDDQIRCMAANQALSKGRMKSRQKKMHSIARLLDIPLSGQSTPSSSVFNMIRSRDGKYFFFLRRETFFFVSFHRLLDYWALVA